jgi:hypothetical protein
VNMERQAIDIALDMTSRPLLIREVQRAPLPPGVREVIRLATGSEDELDQAGKRRGRDAKALRQAAVLFLQQALFHPGADNYRLLGLTQGATAEEIRDHRRLLLKLLHPDRNPSSWEQMLFQQVIGAAADLEKRVARSPNGTALIAPPQQKQRKRARVHRLPTLRRSQPPRWRARLRAYLWRATIAAILLTLSGGIMRLFAGEPISVTLVQVPQTAMELLPW